MYWVMQSLVNYSSLLNFWNILGQTSMALMYSISHFTDTSGVKILASEKGLKMI